MINIAIFVKTLYTFDLNSISLTKNTFKGLKYVI